MYIIWSLDLCQRCRCDGLGKDHLSFQEEMLDREKKKRRSLTHTIPKNQFLMDFKPKCKR